MTSKTKMTRAVSIPFVVSLLLALGAFCADGVRAQSPPRTATITLNVTRKLELHAADGSYLHVLAQGRYEVETGPVNLADVKDGEFIVLKLKYLGGQLLRGDGAGQGTTFILLDASAVDPRLQVDSRIQGPQPDGSVLINLRVGPDFDLPSEGSSQRGAAELGAACFAGWVNPKLSYAELRNLGSLDREWSFTPYPSELTESCKGTVVTIHIQALCHDKGLELFEPMMPVFTHPRCINCHGIVNPLTGANHGGGKIKEGQQCTSPGCHDEEVQVGNLKGAFWDHVAPTEQLFVGKDTRALCQQIVEFEFSEPENGDRVLVDHLERDPFVGMGFDGMRGGAAEDDKPHPPPMSRAQFAELAKKWAVDGNHSCGCSTR